MKKSFFLNKILRHFWAKNSIRMIETRINYDFNIILTTFPSNYYTNS